MSYDDYVILLTEELGSHYRFEKHGGGDRWSGFIYCECYYGRKFVAMRDGEYAPTTFAAYRPFSGLGAVARVEHDRVILLDHRQAYSQDRHWHGNEMSSDSTVIYLAQPDCYKQFMKIPVIHAAMIKYFDIKMPISV